MTVVTFLTAPHESTGSRVGNSTQSHTAVDSLFVSALHRRVARSGERRLCGLQMNADLGFSSAAFGFGSGVFFLGYCLFEVPSNLVLHRVGARRWISRIMISWGAISTAMMFVRTAPTFYALRFLLGAAEAGFFPGVVYYLSHWYPEGQRARAIAAFMTAVPVSGVIGGPLSGALLTLNGLFGLAGWQWLFLVEGLPGFCSALSCSFI